MLLGSKGEPCGGELVLQQSALPLANNPQDTRRAPAFTELRAHDGEHTRARCSNYTKVRQGQDAEETGISLSLALSLILALSCPLWPFIHLLLDISQAWQA